jgi:hypothetical protein
LIERVQRYEKLLSIHNIPINEVPLDGEDQLMEDQPASPAGDPNRAQVIVQDGRARFVDKYEDHYTTLYVLRLGILMLTSLCLVVRYGED